MGKVHRALDDLLTREGEDVRAAEAVALFCYQRGLSIHFAGRSGAEARQAIRTKLIEHKQYIAAHGEDMPEIRNWRWSL